MPVERSVRQTKFSAFSSRRSNGATESSNIGRNSRGGPGSITSQELCVSAPVRKGFGFSFHRQPRRGPVLVQENLRPFGHKCLHRRLGRTHPSALHKEILDMRLHRLVLDQFFPEQPRYQFARDVIRSWPQSARGDYQSRPAQ